MRLLDLLQIKINRLGGPQVVQFGNHWFQRKCTTEVCFEIKLRWRGNSKRNRIYSGNQIGETNSNFESSCRSGESLLHFLFIHKNSRADHETCKKSKN